MSTKYAITTGAAAMARPPEGAVVLFDGTDLSEWRSDRGGGAAKWKIIDDYMQVPKKAGGIHTLREFSHIWDLSITIVNMARLSCIAKMNYQRTSSYSKNSTLFLLNMQRDIILRNRTALMIL